MMMHACSEQTSCKNRNSVAKGVELQIIYSSIQLNQNNFGSLGLEFGGRETGSDLTVQ